MSCVTKVKLKGPSPLKVHPRKVNPGSSSIEDLSNSVLEDREETEDITTDLCRSSARRSAWFNETPWCRVNLLRGLFFKCGTLEERETWVKCPVEFLGEDVVKCFLEMLNCNMLLKLSSWDLDTSTLIFHRWMIMFPLEKKSNQGGSARRQCSHLSWKWKMWAWPEVQR